MSSEETIQESARFAAPGADTADGPPVVLEVDQVTKTYPSQPPVTALREVSLTLTAGEVVAVVGPSGSGKTTLLHLMGSLDRPSAGTVKITGLDVAELSDRQLAALRAGRVGFVFQQFFLAEHATALDNVADGLLYAGVPIRQRRERAAEALAAVGLGDRLQARPTQISVGQRQRVAIARALAAEPQVLILDESVAALDVSIQAQVLNLLADIRDQTGVSYILISHDLAVVRQLTEQAIVMHRGQVVERGATARILDDPQHPYTQRLRASVPRPGWKPARRSRVTVDGETRS
jgi:putative ABC transport system ATP-binding protein